MTVHANTENTILHTNRDTYIGAVQLLKCDFKDVKS
jgi:hypothetical protein